MCAKLGSVHTKSKSRERLIAVIVAFLFLKTLLGAANSIWEDGCTLIHTTEHELGGGGWGMKLQAWTAGSPPLLSPPHTEERVMANSQ